MRTLTIHRNPDMNYEVKEKETKKKAVGRSEAEAVGKWFLEHARNEFELIIQHNKIEYTDWR